MVWIGLVTILSGFGAFPAFTQAAEKPNIIVIFTDDQGYRDVGFTEGDQIRTPHLDALADGGVTFTDGYVTYPVCSPSRAGLMTGRYQGRFGYERNAIYSPNDPNMGMPTDQPLFPAFLQNAGYHTGAIGKWHLGAHIESHHPLNRGFDYFYGMLGGGHRYFPRELTLRDQSDTAWNQRWEHYRLWLLENHRRLKPDQYLTDAFSNRALEFVERNQDKPFFLYLAYNAPHGPLQATEKYLDRYEHITNDKRRTYAAMVSSVDDGVGRLRAKLRELDLETQTLIFFLSDNGGPENKGALNDPLRAGKGSLYEGGIRVPFVMHWPGHVASGKRFSAPVISLDIAATAVDLANAQRHVPNDRPLDGVSLLPYVNGNQAGVPHKRLYWRKGPGATRVVRQGSMKLIVKPNDRTELYDLSQDISEQNNLASKRPELVKKMRAALNRWDSQNIQPRFLGIGQHRQYWRQRGKSWSD
jgi:arylsulfatase A-like enzyme